MIPNPCYGCPKRYPACSATCHDPDEWRAEQNKIKEFKIKYGKSKNLFLTAASEKRHFDWVKNH